MPEGGFHFAQPLWFWLLLTLIPVAWWLWRSAARAARGPIHRYADPHLMPHLTGTREPKARERWGRFLYWSLLWTLLVAAMAGPRWDYEDRPLRDPGRHLLILLDISRSMLVEDVAPNRLIRARHEIEDLLRLGQDLRLGLIAFASVPHLISPVSDDTAVIRASLPVLTTDMVRLQGTRLLPALDRAERLLASLPDEASRAILLISDGDFDEPGLAERVAELAARGIRVHALGVGTADGGRVPGPQGGSVIDHRGQPVRSVLNEALMRDLSTAGGGVYRQASRGDEDTRAILKAATASPSATRISDDRALIWNERYYVPVLLVMTLLLFRFLPWPPRQRRTRE
ncbi:VWA domain-containing protein [Thioalkalicoccus limnaeus]|uniref:VWA domain-containing protein n=1 Tax=Thioalkalicoccus limnaeus TaxID=120681 RepID=A0ABV4BCP6_9GAMM